MSSVWQRQAPTRSGAAGLLGDGLLPCTNEPSPKPSALRLPPTVRFYESLVVTRPSAGMSLRGALRRSNLNRPMPGATPGAMPARPRGVLFLVVFRDFAGDTEADGVDLGQPPAALGN